MKIVTCLDMCIHQPDHMAQNVKETIFVKYCLIGQIKNQVKFMNICTEHISQCNQSEPLGDASGKMVDLMNENGAVLAQHIVGQRYRLYASINPTLVQCHWTEYALDRCWAIFRLPSVEWMWARASDCGPALNRHWLSFVLSCSRHKHQLENVMNMNKSKITAQKHILNISYIRYTQSKCESCVCVQENSDLFRVNEGCVLKTSIPLYR